MKKLLGIVIMGLLLGGNAYASKKTTVSFVCTSKKSPEVSHALIIDLKKNTMQLYNLTYDIYNISETFIDADNLGRLTASGSVRHYLSFNRYTGDMNMTWMYSDGKIHSRYKYNCKKAKKII